MSEAVSVSEAKTQLSKQDYYYERPALRGRRGRARRGTPARTEASGQK
jgi:hypothetical protein